MKQTATKEDDSSGYTHLLSILPPTHDENQKFYLQYIMKNKLENLTPNPISPRRRSAQSRYAGVPSAPVVYFCCDCFCRQSSVAPSSECSLYHQLLLLLPVRVHSWPIAGPQTSRAPGSLNSSTVRRRRLGGNRRL
uniref:(northern house mosquito) hypothetical protein n=1 Tax=Culex pipiens TaxID=7175 RepID=A0A8D8CT52_CULPI